MKSATILGLLALVGLANGDVHELVQDSITMEQGDALATDSEVFNQLFREGKHLEAVELLKQIQTREERSAELDDLLESEEA